MWWTAQTSQKYRLPHLSDAISPLVSMCCTKTILLPGMASRSIPTNFYNRASGEIGSSVTVSYSMALRMRSSRNLNVDLDILSLFKPLLAVVVHRLALRWKRRQDRLKTAAPLLFANKSTVKHATWSNSCLLWYPVLRAVCNASLLFLFFAINCQKRPDEHCISPFLRPVLEVTSRASSEWHGNTFLFPCFNEVQLVK